MCYNFIQYFDYLYSGTVLQPDLTTLYKKEKNTHSHGV